MGNGPELPDAGVGRVVDRKGPFPHRLQLLEFCQPRSLHQPRVEETLRNPEDDLAVDIMLHMLGRLVADPNRPPYHGSREAASQSPR